MSVLRVCRTVLLACLLPIVFGCSSSIFTGDKSNDLKPNTSNSTANPNCQQLDLSNEAVNVPTFRSLVRCLNANHSIPAFEALVNRATDPQLKAILDVFNDELVLNHRRWKDLDVSLAQLDSQQTLDRFFNHLGLMLEHPKLAVSFVKLLRQASFRENKVSPDVLTSIRLISEELASGKGARENSKKLIDTAIRETQTESYKALVKGLKLPIAIGRPALPILSSQVLRYLQDKVRSEHTYGKTLLWGVADGSLFGLLDQFYYGDKTAPKNARTQKASVDNQTQALESLMRFMNSDHKEDVLRNTVRLFQTFDNSIECMDGAKEIANADMYIMEEVVKVDPARVPYWSNRSNLLKLKLASSICEYPDHMNDVVKVLKTLAQSKSAEGYDHEMLVVVAQLIRALKAGDAMPMDAEALSDLKPSMFYSKVRQGGRTETRYPYGVSERYRRFFIQWMGDKSSVNVYTNLADTLAELSGTNRLVLGNLLYFLDVQNRDDLKYLARFVLKPKDELKSGFNSRKRSIYDALTSKLVNLEPATFTGLIEGVADLINSDEKIAEPGLEAIREAMLFNNSNPLIDAAMSIGLKAEAHQEFFTSLFELGETPEFEDAVSLMGSMARNGKLKDLLKGVMTLLRGNTSGALGQPNVVAVGANSAVLSARNQSTLGRPAWKPAKPFWPQKNDGINACNSLDVEVGLADTTAPGWGLQLAGLASCVNSTGEYADFESFVRYASDPRRVVRDGKSFARFTVDLATDYVHVLDREKKRKMLKELGDILTDASTFKSFSDAQEYLRFIFEKNYTQARLSVVQSFSRVFAMIAPIRGKVQELLNLGAKLIDDTRMPRAFALLSDLSRNWKLRQPGKEPQRPNLSQPVMTEFRAMISTFEDPNLSAEEVARIAEERVGEYYFQLLSQVQRFSYANSTDFKNNIKPMLDRMANPKNQFIEHALSFFYSIDNDPYDPEWLDGWLHRQAGKVRPILYYYPGQFPGEVKPTVRLVSQLDLLELIVIDADFTLDELGQNGGFFLGEESDANFAIKYLSKLAQSGDRLQNWVDELHRDTDRYYNLIFPKNDNPLPFPMSGPAKKAARWAVNHGIKPELRRRIFNLKQVSVVVDDLIKEESVARHPVTGKKLIRNDLGLLREFFAAILSATPPQYRNVYKKEVNSLSFVGSMVGFGVLRNIATSIWEFENDAAKPVKISHLLKLLTELALSERGTGRGHTINPNTIAMLDHLLRKDYRDYNSADFNQRYVFVGKLIDKIFSWTAKDLPLYSAAASGHFRTLSLIKGSLYNLSLVYDDLELVSRRQGIDLPTALAIDLKPLLSEARGTKFLGENLDLLESVFIDSENFKYFELLDLAAHQSLGLRSRDYREDHAFGDFAELFNIALKDLSVFDGHLARVGVDVMEYLYNETPSRMKAATHTLSAMRDDAEYKNFRARSFDAVSADLSNWLVNARGDKELPRRLPGYLAAHLRNGDALALLEFIGAESANKSDQFYRNMKFAGQPRYIRALQDALTELKSGLQNTN